MNLDSLEFLELIEVAKSTAKEAGIAIMGIYQNSDFEIEMKGDDSPLTKADKLGHEIIEKYLNSTGLPVLSEEGKATPYEIRKNWDLYWLIDPLDGTKEFIKKNGEFTVNIALIQSGAPVLGVVYAPALKVLYWGSQQGAFRQYSGKEAEKLERFTYLEVKTIVASRSHLNDETADFIAQYPDVQLISMGSSLKFLLVAEGKAQVYPRFAPTMEWDTAAAQAIVEAAGGSVVIYPTFERMTYNKINLLNNWFIVKA